MDISMEEPRTALDSRPHLNFCAGLGTDRVGRVGRVLAELVEYMTELVGCCMAELVGCCMAELAEYFECRMGIY